MTRGSYVPAIRRRVENEASVDPPRSVTDILRDLLRNRLVLVPLAALAAVGIVIAAVIALRGGYDASRSAGTTPPPPGFDGPLRPGNGMPTLLIHPPQILRGQNASGTGGIPLIDKLRAALARFETVNVAIDQSRAAAGSAAPTSPADYQLISTGEYRDDGTADVRFRLLDVAEGTVLWSRSFERLRIGADDTATEDRLARQVAMTLLPPFGVVRANERRKQLAGQAGDPRNRCIVETSESLRSFDPIQHSRARTCLEALTTRDPGFALGFSYLAALQTREFQYGFGAPGMPDPALLDRALRAARQGVELSPESARGYQMLSTVLFARRDLPAAFAAGDRAIALNPYDMTILSDYGGRLIASGEIDRGMEMLNRAAEEGAVRASWYHFYLFLGSYLKGDIATAARHAALGNTESFPPGLVAKALVAASDGNREAARKSYDELVALRAAWRDKPREELARLFPAPEIADRLARDLANAGLAPAP
jgi:tetratricopeptide (TPR) repeat protein